MTTAAGTSEHGRATGEPLVEARSLYRFFRSGDEETLALKGVMIAVGAGELVVVTGPSGSGKSTLLSCLAGLDDPDGGSVRIVGERISHRAEAARCRVRAKRIGFLGQTANLFGHLTVVSNVVLAQRLGGRGPRPASDTLLETLGLSHRAGAYPEELSGGETVRAGIAVALANDPPVILADEPTGELDTATEDEVLVHLARAAHAGAAVLVASHSPAVAQAADRVVRLHDGTVAA